MPATAPSTTPSSTTPSITTSSITRTSAREPKAYVPVLDALETEKAIAFLKPLFTRVLCDHLDLQPVSAPVLAESGTGINDDLNGVEEPVQFALPGTSGIRAEVVQSLAKWKRLRLHTLGIEEGRGICTDMRALRPDETPGPLHSVYVDQWDWEKHMPYEQRSRAYLKATVRSIYRAIRDVESALAERFPALEATLPREVTFVDAEHLRSCYPELTPKEREDAFCREHGAIFVMGIGAELSDGAAHDGRAPDYDDWSTRTREGHCGLNGDLILWHEGLGRAVEVSSMGIRVDAEALRRQLAMTGTTNRLALPFHRKLMDGALPQSIGGGIGQSRICLFLLQKRHVGEVQVSLWPESERERCAEEGIPLMS